MAIFGVSLFGFDLFKTKTEIQIISLAIDITELAECQCWADEQSGEFAAGCSLAREASKDISSGIASDIPSDIPSDMPSDMPSDTSRSHPNTFQQIQRKAAT